MDQYWFLVAMAVDSLLFGVPAALLLDQLLRYQYNNYRNEWNQDGRPCGFLWCPPDADWWYTGIFNFFQWRWFFRTPSWIRTNRYCLWKLYWIRCLSVCGSVIGVLIFYALLYHGNR